jgi:hypothetical protein
LFAVLTFVCSLCSRLFVRCAHVCLFAVLTLNRLFVRCAHVESYNFTIPRFHDSTIPRQLKAQTKGALKPPQYLTDCISYPLFVADFAPHRRYSIAIASPNNRLTASPIKRFHDFTIKRFHDLTIQQKKKNCRNY